MFRFTIRDVLWLMVVVGMGCAWWADSAIKSHDFLKFSNGLIEAQSNAERQRDIIESAIEREGYMVDWSWDGKREFNVVLSKKSEEGPDGKQPKE